MSLPYEWVMYFLCLVHEWIMSLPNLYYTNESYPYSVLYTNESCLYYISPRTEGIRLQLIVNPKFCKFFLGWASSSPSFFQHFSLSRLNPNLWNTPKLPQNPNQEEWLNPKKCGKKWVLVDFPVFGEKGATLLHHGLVGAVSWKSREGCVMKIREGCVMNSPICTVLMTLVRSSGRAATSG